MSDAPVGTDPQLPPPQVKSLNKNFDSISLLGLFFCTLILILFLVRAPFSSGFMLDETITQWITNDQLDDTIRKSWIFQGQSPLYFVLIWYYRFVGAQSEVQLRLTSLISMILSAIPLIICAQRLKLKYSLAVVLLTLMSDELIVRYAIMLRPYAIGLLFHNLAAALFLSWVVTEKRTYIYIYSIVLAITLYFQYLFAPAIGIHLLMYILLAKKYRYKDCILLLWCYFFTLIMLIPGFLHITSWLSRAAMLESIPAPTFQQLIGRTFPLGVLGLSALGIVSGALYYPWRTKSGDWRVGIILAAWAFGPSLLLYLVYCTSGINLIIDRYYIWRAPGLALFVTYIFNRIDSIHILKVAITVWALFIITVESLRVYKVDDWRAVQHALAGYSETSPVLFNSGLLELKTVPYPETGAESAYRRTPFEVYPIAQQLVPIPPSFEGDEYTFFLNTEVLPKIKSKSEFILVIPSNHKIFYDEKIISSTDYFKKLFTILGFDAIKTSQIGVLNITSFALSKKVGFKDKY
jgi:hypothetical protein